MDKNAKIFVAGHTGLVGGGLVRALRKAGYMNLVFARHVDVDLRDQRATRTFFEQERPDYVFIAAAKVGGIWANSTMPAQFIYDNLMIEANVIDSAWRSGTKKLLFLGSSCIYPKFAPQPIKEEYLLTGALEPTNEFYALAKISGIRMGQAYRKQYGFDTISAMPCNLYGQGDNFDPATSHVIPGLLRRFHEAVLADKPEIVIWGTGTPLREFLHVDDLADACIFLMNNYSDVPHINVGNGKEISIADLAALLAEITGYRGRIIFDATKPDGTPRKLMDCSRLFTLGWQPHISLREGLQSTYEWYRDTVGREGQASC